MADDLHSGERVTVCTRHYYGSGTVIRRKRNGWYLVRCDDGKERHMSRQSCHPVGRPRDTTLHALTRQPTYTKPGTTYRHKDPPVRSRKYLKWIRTQPCAACSKGPPSEASHHPEPGHGSMGSKTHDTRTIPLCAECHREHHAGSESVVEDRLWVERQITRCLTRWLRQEWSG